MRLLVIDGHWARHRDIQTEAVVVIETPRRWLRLGMFYGEPPGSHIGLWHTNTGSVHGWNLRIGRRYVRCLTLLAHTRPSRG